MNKKSSKKLKQNLDTKKQQMYVLLKEKNSLIWSLLKSLPLPMISAVFSVIYKKCGKKNCKCYKGEKHGPYPAIQFKDGTKWTLKMIKLEEGSSIKKKAKNYQKYQRGLAQINKLNKQINQLLQEARDENLEDYR